jgi:hypothetical protein
MPILGVVSLVMSEVDVKRERVNRLRFFGATGSLLGMFVIGMALISIMAARQIG